MVLLTIYSIGKETSFMNKRYFTPSEINSFTRCPEQWRLDKARKRNEITVTPKQYHIEQLRFRRGDQVHEDFNKGYGIPLNQ